MTTTTTNQRVFAGDILAMLYQVANMAAKNSADIMKLQGDLINYSYEYSCDSANYAAQSKLMEATSAFISGGISIAGSAVTISGSVKDAAVSKKEYDAINKIREKPVDPTKMVPTPGTVASPADTPATPVMRHDSEHYFATEADKMAELRGTKARFAKEHNTAKSMEQVGQMFNMGFSPIVQGITKAQEAGYDAQKMVAEAEAQLMNSNLQIVGKLYDGFMSILNSAGDLAKTEGQVLVTISTRA